MFLNCHTYHSLRYGTIPVSEVVKLAKGLGIQQLALTDINAMAGVYDFVKACRDQGIKPIVGIEFRTNRHFRFIALAKNLEGYAEICTYLTELNLAEKEVPAQAPNFKNVFVVYSLATAPQQLKSFEYIGVRANELTKMIQLQWRNRFEKMVVLHPVTIRNEQEFDLHKILRAVELNVILSKLSENDYCQNQEKFISPEQLAQQFQHFPQFIETTEKLLNACSFDFQFNTLRNKKYFTGNANDDRELLKQLANEGMFRRYGSQYAAAKIRVNRELKVIDDLEFSGYFLITWDIIQFSNSKGFLHVGRGSGANSIVSYCLGITDICPIELDLYFERFLNPERTSPPDFDIDWSWTDRDTILEYVFSKYGKEHVAFTGTTVEFKYRSIIRELGKVFGLPKEELDVLTRTAKIQHDTNDILRQVHYYGTMLERYPNQRSMHSCGILISEEPISNFIVLELPPKGFPTAQINMHVAEAIGFEKFDILSQRGIGHINESVQLIEKNQGIKVDIRNVALTKDEKQSNEYLKQGNTIGCFYIESPAMRGLLRKLACENYRTLVAASSVIRPGVAQSGMMREYIFRHNNPTKFEYFHPIFEQYLGETYGVMVYQEDVIKIAHHFAGIDLAKADILRRAMSGKTRSKKELDGVRATYFENCQRMGYSETLANEVYRQIESFAGYSFCKAHSASYAMESYQSLYLKVYFPIEFMVAVINNEGGFYRVEVYIHEAKMAGASIHTPCVNKSEYGATLYGKDVYLGLKVLQKLEHKNTQYIIEERKRNGDFQSLDDFIHRVPIGIESLQVLIYSGAFHFTGQSKNELVLKARMLLSNFNAENRDEFLIKEPATEYKLPLLHRSLFEDAFDEIEIIGFPVSCSPFDLLKTKFRGEVKINEMATLSKQRIKLVAYLISRKDVPIKSGMMHFGTWIDSEGFYFDTTHWPTSLVNYPFLGGGCYLLQGVVDVDFGFPTIVVEKMAKLPFIADPRYDDPKDSTLSRGNLLKMNASTTQRSPYPTEREIALPRHASKGS
ncbi:MAG: DNA polymerase III subunit alpha [Bacteroidota bacterium]